MNPLPRALARTLLAASISCILAPALAAASDESVPRRIVDRALVLPRKMFELSLPVNANLTAAGADALSINPTLTYGLTDSTAIAVRSVRGLCVSSSADAVACRHLFNDVALDLSMRLVDDQVFDLAFGTSLGLAPVGNPVALAGELRLVGRVVAGSWALTLAPSINHGFTSRNEGLKLVGAMFPLGTFAFGGMQVVEGNRDFVAVPASLVFQITRELALIGGASVQGPVNPASGTVKRNLTVPVGLASIFSLAEGLDLGASLTVADLRRNARGVTLSMLAVIRD